MSQPVARGIYAFHQTTHFSHYNAATPNWKPAEVATTGRMKRNLLTSPGHIARLKLGFRGRRQSACQSDGASGRFANTGKVASQLHPGCRTGAVFAQSKNSSVCSTEALSIGTPRESDSLSNVSIAADFTAIRHFDYRHEFLAHEFQRIQASTGWPLSCVGKGTFFDTLGKLKMIYEFKA